MNISVQPNSGQSNYDLTLQTIGSLDGFIALLNDNSIINSDTPPIVPFNYNSNSVLSRVISGNIFSTLS